jgi:hypothetical protein
MDGNTECIPSPAMGQLFFPGFSSLFPRFGNRAKRIGQSICYLVDIGSSWRCRHTSSKRAKQAHHGENWLLPRLNGSFRAGTYHSGYIPVRGRYAPAIRIAQNRFSVDVHAGGRPPWQVSPFRGDEKFVQAKHTHQQQSKKWDCKQQRVPGGTQNRLVHDDLRESRHSA